MHLAMLSQSKHGIPFGVRAKNKLPVAVDPEEEDERVTVSECSVRNVCPANRKSKELRRTTTTRDHFNEDDDAHHDGGHQVQGRYRQRAPC